MAKKSEGNFSTTEKKKEEKKKKVAKPCAAKEGVIEKSLFDESKPKVSHWIHVVGDIYAFKCGNGLLIKTEGQVVFAPDVRIIKSKEHQFNEIASW